MPRLGVARDVGERRRGWGPGSWCSPPPGLRSRGGPRLAAVGPVARRPRGRHHRPGPDDELDLDPALATCVQQSLRGPRLAAAAPDTEPDRARRDRRRVARASQRSLGPTTAGFYATRSAEDSAARSLARLRPTVERPCAATASPPRAPQYPTPRRNSQLEAPNRRPHLLARQRDDPHRRCSDHINSVLGTRTSWRRWTRPRGEAPRPLRVRAIVVMVYWRSPHRSRYSRRR